MSDLLPKFTNPPVVETAIGVSFHPIMQWLTPHFGLYWAQIRDKYQKCAVKPPLPLETENPAFAKQEMLITFGSNNERCWFFDDLEEWLIQVQATRFVSNWRRRGSEYPNYESFAERFFEQWGQFNSFLKSEGIQIPTAAVAEVSYVNHIEVDEAYSSLENAFPVWGTLSEHKFLPTPDGVGFNAVFRIEEDKGRLDINTVPVVRHIDGHRTMQMNVVAKTAVAPTADGLKEALALSHQWVVKGFADFTSGEMHKAWGRSQ